jgi:seryl-tRNA synthetase
LGIIPSIVALSLFLKGKSVILSIQMLDVNLLRDEPERVRKAIRTKNANPKLVDTFLELDSSWRELTKELDELRAEQKRLSEKREIDKAKKNKETIKSKELTITDIEKEREIVWLQIPNLPSEDTPVGKDEGSNKVLRKWGEPKDFSGDGGFKAQDHLEIGERLGLIDVESASKVTSTRFAYLKGDMVKLEMALVQYAFDVLADSSILRLVADKVRPGYSSKPFVPVLPPVMIRPDVMKKMARLEPKDERYYLPEDDLYLIGSAEHTLGPIHMDETLKESNLPVRYVGFSTSFRREAGSYGKDTRGILRVHQFDKVEIESFTLSEDSIIEQDFFVAIQEYLMQSLEIPYQVVICSTGDQGDPDARHIDIESWLPSQNRYRETHSADLMTDYQSRRLNIRVKRSNGKIEFVHMNDATVFAGRTMIAILENYQMPDGRILTPKVLQKYVGKEFIG